MRFALNAAALLLCALLLGGCASVRQAFSEEPTDVVAASPSATETPDTADSEVGMELNSDGPIEITGKVYELWVAEIVANPDKYLGKRLSIEGTLGIYPASSYVYRRGPGCCGNDGKMIGLEVECGGDTPPDGSWVIAEGVLDTYEHNGYTNLIIRVDKLALS